MSKTAARPKLSEKGLLTPDNCVVALIDLQPQMLFGVANFDRQTIINNNVALAKAARVFDVPVVLSTVETKGFSGNIWPQIQAVFPESRRRSSAVVHELAGTTRTSSPRSRRPAARRSCWPACGPRPASRCRRSRRSTTATRSTWSRTAAAT